jgi:hypothetical protein
VIPRGHNHYFQPRAFHPRPDGTKEVHRQCVCGLEERRIFRADGKPSGVKFRFAGLWLEPLDLLRLLPVPMAECPDCRGVPQLVECDTCAGVGVVESHDGMMLRLPDLRVNPPDEQAAG